MSVIIVGVIMALFVIPWWITVFAATLNSLGKKLVLFYLEEKKKMIMQMQEDAVGTKFRN